MQRSVLTAGLLVGATRLVGVAMGVVVTAVLGRSLGPEGLGAYSYVLIVLTLLAVPVSNGWSTMLLRQVSTADSESHWANAKGMLLRGTQLAGLSAAGTGLAGALLTSIFGDGLDSSVIWGPAIWAGLGVVLFFDQVSALRSAMLRGLNHPVWGQAPETLIRPTLLLATFLTLAALATSDVYIGHAVAALAVAAFLAALAGLWVLQVKLPAVFTQVKATFQTKQWYRSSALLTGNAALILVNTYVDTLLLGALGTLMQVGIYRVAMLTSIVSGFTYTAFNLLAAQRFSHLNNRIDVGDLQSTAVFMARIALLGSLPVPIVFWYYGDELLTMAFGAAFIGALLPMAPLLVGQILNAAFGMSRTLLVMSGHEASALKFTIVAVFLNALICVALIPRIGALGAAIASTASTSIWNAMMWYHARQVTGVDTSVLNLGGSRS